MSTSPHPADVERAQRLVRDCEIDLRRKLSAGQRRDLIADHSAHLAGRGWTMDYIASVVAELAA